MKKVFLGVIILIAFVLRFYGLGEYPQGFHRDEAFFGYNAYSLLKTGREMTGDFLPLHLASYLYSPAGYSYLATVPIALFGLSEFSVRLSSAFFGTLSVPLLYFLTLTLFTTYRYKNSLALIASVLFAIMPWHINLSRTATENSVVVFFFLLAIVFFLKWKEKQSYFLLVITFVLFFITLFLYQAPRAFLPFFLPLLFITLASEQTKMHWKASVALFIVMLAPIVFVLSSPTLSLRISSLSLAHSKEASLVLTEAIHRDGEEGVNNVITRVFHNKLLVFSDQFLTNYFSHFTHSFLFTQAGLPDRYRVPEAGLLYLPLLPFLLFGSFALMKEKKAICLFLIGWILLSPIGSALTFDDIPNLQRTLFMLPPIITITSFGIVWAFHSVQKHRKLYLSLVSLFVLSMIFFFFRYLHEYYIHAPAYRPWYRNAGYKTLVSGVNDRVSMYQKAVITNRESAPAVFFLFYLQYDPSRFQDETKDTATTDFDRINFGMYEFSQEECPAREIVQDSSIKKTFEKDILYVNSGLCEEPNSLRIIETIQREDNSDVFHIVETKD